MPFSFIPEKPDASTESIVEVTDSTRRNLRALRDAITLGDMPGWDMEVMQGDGETPALGSFLAEPRFLSFTKGGKFLGVRLHYSSGTVTKVEFLQRASGTDPWAPLADAENPKYVMNFTYNSGYLSKITWSDSV